MPAACDLRMFRPGAGWLLAGLLPVVGVALVAVAVGGRWPVSRLLKERDPTTLLADACAVIAALPAPGQRLDRRVLVPGRPHALDDNTPLAGLVFALTGVTGVALATPGMPSASTSTPSLEDSSPSACTRPGGTFRRQPS